MKISARNMLRGTVKTITFGAVNTEVVIELPGGEVIVSVAVGRRIGVGLARGLDAPRVAVRRQIGAGEVPTAGHPGVDARLGAQDRAVQRPAARREGAFQQRPGRAAGGQRRGQDERPRRADASSGGCAPPPVE